MSRCAFTVTAAAVFSGREAGSALEGRRQPALRAEAGFYRDASQGDVDYAMLTKVYQTLRVTPAMEAGLSAHVWSIGELVCVLDQVEKKAA